MRFRPQEIAAAAALHAAGLPWTPQPGQFVWDRDGLIQQGSPFHDRVYFILELKHFVRRAGTVERLKAAMYWLPTWHQGRELLAQQGIGDDRLVEALNRRRAIETHRELLVVYDLIGQSLGWTAPPGWDDAV